MWGQVCRICDSKGSIKDHPHACGDKHRSRRELRNRRGSSPRVWGQVRRGKRNMVSVRIIPTRVGTSLCQCLTPCQCWDHPHACGDKIVNEYLRHNRRGSSPRVWGQGLDALVRTVCSGIIPTRVGTRSLCSWSLQRHGDHPHACGDKTYEIYP